jgi:hypothetical protein
MKNTNSVSQSSSSQTNHHLPLTVIPLLLPSLTNRIRFTVGPAQFGKLLHGKQGVKK